MGVCENRSVQTSARTRFLEKALAIEAVDANSAGEHELWWSPQDPAPRPFWHTNVVLGREFFDEITRSVVPVDMRALRLVKRSPLALDIYVWLTYRMSYLKRPCLIPWDELRTQFGSDYQRTRDFQVRFCSQMPQVIGVYPDLRVQTAQTGVLLKPSPTHICRARPRAEMGS